MATIAEALQAALDHRRAGRLAQAESLYRRVLEHDPRQPNALHGLGVLAHEVGRRDLALQLIGQAIAVDPSRAHSHFDLGESYRGLGRRAEARASYEQALRNDRDLRARLAVLYRRAAPELDFVAPHCRDAASGRPPGDRSASAFSPTSSSATRSASSTWGSSDTCRGSTSP